MNLDELEQSLKAEGKKSPQKVIVFGDPKVGKTELVGKLAHHFPMTWFDLEDGHATLLKLPSEAKKNINLIQVPDTRESPQAQDTIRRIFTNPGPHKICADHGKIGCMVCTKSQRPFHTVDFANLRKNEIVVIDSLTQLSNSAMAKVMEKEDSLAKPEWDHYAKQGFILDRILSQVQAASFHVVVISHVTETEMIDGKKKLVPFGGTTNFARSISRYFGHSVYLYSSNKQHKAASESTFSTQISTGSRSDFSIESLKEPNLLEIFQ